MSKLNAAISTLRIVDLDPALKADLKNFCIESIAALKFIVNLQTTELPLISTPLSHNQNAVFAVQFKKEAISLIKDAIITQNEADAVSIILELYKLITEIYNK